MLEVNYDPVGKGNVKRGRNIKDHDNHYLPEFCNSSSLIF